MKKYAALFLLFFALSACSSKKDDQAGGGTKKEIYFKLTIDGVERELENIHYARAGKNVQMATWGKNGFPNLNVVLTTKTEGDFSGSYAYHYDVSAGTSIILYGIGDANGYESHWWDCPNDHPLLRPSPGTLVIENVEQQGSDEFITGKFNVEVYQPQGDCPYNEIKTIKITAEFRLKRAR